MGGAEPDVGVRVGLLPRNLCPTTGSRLLLRWEVLLGKRFGGMGGAAGVALWHDWVKGGTRVSKVLSAVACVEEGDGVLTPCVVGMLEGRSR